MGHRKPRLAFFIILLCVLQGRFPWWGADAMGESGSVQRITPETAETTPMPTAGMPKPDATAPSILAAPTVTARALLAIPAVRALPRPGGDARKILCYVGIAAAALHIIAAWQVPFAVYGRPYRGNPGGSWAMGMLEVLSPLGNGFWAWLGRCLAVPLYLMPLIGSFPAMPYLGGALRGKHWRGDWAFVLALLPLPPPAPPSPAGCRAWKQGMARRACAMHAGRTTHRAACPVGISGSKKGSSYEKSLFMPVAGNALAAWRL